MADYIVTSPAEAAEGNFSITVGEHTTGEINHPASASTIQGALRALEGQSGAGVTGSSGGPYTIKGLSAQPVFNSGTIKGSFSVKVSSPEPEPHKEPNADEHKEDNMSKYDELNTAKGKLIRKALGGLILAAPMSVEVPDKLFIDAKGGFADFKSLGYKGVGYVTKGDGITFSRETEQSEIESFGVQEPTRIDFTKDVTSAAFKCQETNKQVLEMYNNVDLTDVKADENGEFSFNSPRQPTATYRRVIYISKDGNGDDAKFIIKVMPRAIVSEVQEQQWSNESEIAYGLTLKATFDDEVGYAVRHVFGGPGFTALLEDMGFNA